MLNDLFIKLDYHEHMQSLKKNKSDQSDRYRFNETGEKTGQICL